MADLHIRDRVKELRRVRARDLVPHSRNWRHHGTAQIAALKAMLSEIGFAGALLARETNDGKLTLIDGHLRAGISGDDVVPVLILDLNEQEVADLGLTPKLLNGPNP